MPDDSKHVPVGAAPGYQIEERFPTPPPLIHAPPIGSVSPEQREARILRCWARLTRGMAQSAPARGDSLGASWHELATEYEAMLKELAPELLPSPTPDRPIELRHQPQPVIPMAGPVPSSTDQLLAQVLDELRRR